MKATNLPKTDLTGLCDPYVTVAIDGNFDCQKTQIKKVELNPVWNESFYLPVKDPQNQIITVSLFDFNSIASDQLLEKWEIPIPDNDDSINEKFDFFFYKKKIKLL